MDTITLPVTYAPANITHAALISAGIIIATLIPVFIISYKRNGLKEATYVSAIAGIILAGIPVLTITIYSETTPDILIKTDDIQHIANESGYTYYEHDNRTSLKEPTQETLRVDETTTLNLLDNTTGKLCNATFESVIFDTTPPTPKEFVYAISCNKYPSP